MFFFISGLAENVQGQLQSIEARLLGGEENIPLRPLAVQQQIAYRPLPQKMIE